MMAGTTSLVSSNWEKSITHTYNAGQIQILFLKQNLWEWKLYRNGRRNKLLSSIQAYNWFQNKSQWVTLSEKKKKQKKTVRTCRFLPRKFIIAPNFPWFFYLQTLHNLLLSYLSYHYFNIKQLYTKTLPPMYRRDVLKCSFYTHRHLDP